MTARAATCLAVFLAAAAVACRRKLSDKELSDRLMAAVGESDRRAAAGDAEGALASLRGAEHLGLRPEYLEMVLVKEAQIEHKLGHNDDALSLCARAIADKNATGARIALMEKANILADMGRKKESAGVFKEFIDGSNLTPEQRKDAEEKLKASGL